MKIRIYRRKNWKYYPAFSIHKDRCHCSNPACGATDMHTTGYSICFWKYYIVVEYDRPKGCDAPF